LLLIFYCFIKLAHASCVPFIFRISAGLLGILVIFFVVNNRRQHAAKELGCCALNGESNILPTNLAIVYFILKKQSKYTISTMIALQDIIVSLKSSIYYNFFQSSKAVILNLHQIKLFIINLFNIWTSRHLNYQIRKSLFNNEPSSIRNNSA